MFLLNLNALTLLLSLACISNGSVQDQIYQNSLTAIFSPSLCQLKLICAITQSPSYELRTSPFMKGISALSRYEGNSSATAMLELAISTGNICQLFAQLMKTEYYDQQVLKADLAAVLLHIVHTRPPVLYRPCRTWASHTKGNM